MENEENDHGEILAKWNFPEFEKIQRTKGWYFGAFVIFSFLMLYALVTINFLFAVIIIIGAVIILVKNRFEPSQITFAITEDGFELENKFYNFDLIKYFYIIYNPPETKNLYLEFKSIIKPRLIIPLENQNPLEIRDILNQYIEENLEKEVEPASEAFRKIFKL